MADWSPRRAALATFLLVVVPPLDAQTAPRSALTPVEVAAWRADLQFLATEFPRRHLNAFYWTPRERFEAAVRDLDQRIPRLQRDQVIIGLGRLVAMLGDAHSNLILAGPEVGFREYPIQLARFSDGLFVRAAAPALQGLVGARVVRIGTVSADAALDSAGLVISHENPYWVLAQGPRVLIVAEALHALGLSDSPDSARFVVMQDGRERAVWLRPSATVAGGHDAAVPADWVDMRQGSAPLSARRPGDAFWAEYLPGQRALYVCYRAVAFTGPGGELNGAFWQRVFALADSVRPERLVVDLRENGGGNGALNRAPVRGLIQRPFADRPDRLFVLIGRNTFSAAQQLTNDLAYWTNATLIGEPTGNAPAQFGDARPMQLPNSHLTVRVSTRWHQGRQAEGDRRFTAPRYAITPSSDDYRAGRDPALAFAVGAEARPTLEALLGEALGRGDTALAARRLTDYRGDPVNAFADIEAETNRAGYALLGAGRLQDAVTVFRMNADAFPRSANVHDSLGEAYERAGRREDAIASYRRALAIDATFGSSREGLRRLGATP